MKPLAECAQCILKWTYERTAPAASEQQRHELMRTLLDVLYREFMPEWNLGQIANRTLEAVNKYIWASAAFYDGIKKKNNQAAEALLPSAGEFIQKGKTNQERFERACYLASAGNVSPISAPSGAFEFSDAENIIAGKGPLPSIIGDVYGTARGRNRVLFLTDNAGEIGFDSLLIKELKAMGSQITLVVKEDPFFEDANVGDAVDFGLDMLADHILATRGVFLPGLSTSALDEAYRQSDLVIAKGTFNFEALGDEPTGKPTIYMLKVKCDPLSKKNEVAKGRFIVKLE
jgi:damage-control phosphatase, subfamily I